MVAFAQNPTAILQVDLKGVGNVPGTCGGIFQGYIWTDRTSAIYFTSYSSGNIVYSMKLYFRTRMFKLIYQHIGN